MPEKELFEAIRREDVIIFAGAGFSKYAGYPLGGELAAILHATLPADLQAEISPQLPLDYLTEEIVRKMGGSRDFLNETLDNIFTAAPISLTDHEAVASIPHFQTIITTNYDSLFEQAYGMRANTIFRNDQVSTWDDKKVNIIKIHGDLSDKETIILTREDYSRFYRLDYASPFWASVIQKISTKHVLFLGYGYEDPNIWAIFERISSFLTTGKKAMYFVAPGQKQDKIDFLSRKQIEYLDYTGATFLEKLTDRIKEHIFKDLEDGIVGPETFRAFTRANNAAVSLDSADQGFKLGTIKGIDGNEAHWNAQFTYPKNSDYSERHEAFFNSNKLLELVLTAEELLTFKMSVQGMKLMDKDSLAHLSIKKTPRIIEYDLSFLTEGLEFNGLKADVYTANQSIRMLTKLHSLSIEINLHFNGSSDVASTWNMEHAENYGSVQQEIEVYSFIIHLFRQKKFTIFFKNGGSHSSVSPQGNSRYADDAEFYLNYFKGLKKVEQAFGIKFRDFWGIDNSSFHSLEWLLKVIEGEPFDRQGDYPIEYEEIEPQMLGYFEQLEEPGVSDHPLEMTMNTNKSVTLHGLNLPVPGYHIVIPQASVKNLDELKTGETKRIVFFSRTGTMQEYFRIEPYRQATE